MEHIVVLGGGVGGTLVANLISRKLKRAIDDGRVKVRVVDTTGTHVYQPGFMYVAMGSEDAASLRRPEQQLLDERVDLLSVTSWPSMKRPPRSGWRTARSCTPVVAERVAAAVEGRQPDERDAFCTGKVMCFLEIGDGKGTLLRFDYEHPPHPPAPSRLWHLGKVAFNKTYFRIVPRGRGGSLERRL